MKHGPKWKEALAATALAVALFATTIAVVAAIGGSLQFLLRQACP